MSERRACPRCSARIARRSVIVAGGRTMARSRARLRALAAERRRFGYRRLGLLLAREGVLAEPQEAAAAVCRGAVAGAPSRRSQAGARHAGADDAAGRPEPALVAGLRVGHAVGRATVPDAVRGRRFHARMPGPGRRHVAVRPARGARAGRDRGGARAAVDGGERQRNGADQQAILLLVAGPWRRLALHRAGQAAAERLRRELQRQGCATNA